MGLRFGGNLSARGDGAPSVRQELARSNRTLRARHPQKAYPEVNPSNCETFSDCMGGNMDDWEKRGTCCARFASQDSKLGQTYCGVYDGTAYQSSLSGTCSVMKRNFATDAAFAAQWNVPTNVLTQLTSACDAWCTEKENDESWCEAREFEKCWTDAGLRETAQKACCAGFPQVHDWRCYQVFDYSSNCLVPDANGKFPNAAICSTWCEKTRRTSSYHYVCTWPEKIRNCVTDGTDFYQCCVDAESQGNMEGTCNGFKEHGPCDWTDSANPAPLSAMCIPYCSRYSGRDRPIWCRYNDFVGCLSDAKDANEIKGKCCGKFGTGTLPSICSYTQYAFTEDPAIPNSQPDDWDVETLCDNLRKKGAESQWSPCGLEITRDELSEVCNAFCSNAPEDDVPEWCVQGDEDKFEACLAGKEVDEMTPTPRPGYDTPDVAYNNIEEAYGGFLWTADVTAKCCGENPKAPSCSEVIGACKEIFSSKYESKRDQIEDGDYGEDDEESLERSVRYCNKLCGSFEDEPDWCDNIPANPLLAGEIAAIVLGCFLFVAIGGIVVLAILYVRKPGVGGATP